jgi:hypothetical protein
VAAFFMPEKSSYPTVQELAALPENEFLELCRDSARSDSEQAFKRVGFSALNAATQGALATMFAVSGLPYAAIGTVISAAIAGVSVWQGIQALGEGVQSASRSSSADTVLHVLYPPEPPGTLVHDTEPAGPIEQVPQSLGRKAVER